MDLESISVSLLKLSFHLRSMAFSLNGVQLKEPERIGIKVSHKNKTGCFEVMTVDLQYLLWILMDKTPCTKFVSQENVQSAHFMHKMHILYPILLKVRFFKSNFELSANFEIESLNRLIFRERFENESKLTLILTKITGLCPS